MKNRLYCNSLTGKKSIYLNNLLGKEINICCVKEEEPIEIEKIKITIMKQFIVPLCCKNWKEIKENYFNLSRLNNKINELKIKHPEYDLNIYKNMLQFVSIGYTEHLNLEKMEKKYYGLSGENTASMVFNTNFIRLKAEYELYHLIIGKPELGHEYNQDILEKIKNLLVNEEITYTDIYNQIINI